MFINIIDKFISNFIDNFYLKKIKTIKIKKDDSIINLANIYYDNNIKQILKTFDINVTTLNEKLRKKDMAYTTHK